MFDFTLLDLEMLAKFWVYIIGFFIAGFSASWFIRSELTKTASKNFRSEKEKFEVEKAALLKIKEQYEALCKDIEKSKQYWLYKEESKQEYTGDDPSELLHKGLKKR